MKCYGYLDRSYMKETLLTKNSKEATVFQESLVECKRAYSTQEDTMRFFILCVNEWLPYQKLNAVFAWLKSRSLSPSRSPSEHWKCERMNKSNKPFGMCKTNTDNYIRLKSSKKTSASFNHNKPTILIVVDSCWQTQKWQHIRIKSTTASIIPFRWVSIPTIF